ncbi:hypothetical protein PG993_004510 [Apiospora rasikravindrae]|uniref:Uncharacterized protein n=1 Tax=Apiospora rasikravindrae TaxID=990691 RepID=A0ABR1TCY2_9PEZI
MKWTNTILSLAFMAKAIMASPFVHNRANGIDVYKLTVSGGNRELDGQVLRMKASKIGVYGSGDKYMTVKVYPASSEKPGCNTLHTYPIGIVDHAIAVNGTGAFRDFIDVVQPAGLSASNTMTNWNSFQMSENRLKVDMGGKWVAFPDPDQGWNVKWFDGKSMVAQDYIPITIKYTKVDN